MSQIDFYNLFKLGLPLVILFFTAAIILLTSFTKKASALTKAFVIVGIVAAFVLSWRGWIDIGHAGDLSVVSADMLVFDRMAHVGWLIVLISACLTVLMSVSYGGASKPEYYSLILFSSLGMAFLVSANDLLVIFLAIETMSLAVYVLSAFIRQNTKGTEAALKYFLMGAFASAFLLMGIAFIFGSLGTTNLPLIAERAREILVAQEKYYYLIGTSLILIGLSFKIALVPFHAWVPDVYEGAPTPVTAFMASALKTAAFVALIRVAGAMFSGDSWRDFIIVASVITMLVGNLAAIVQQNIKRMLAYSSISHAGYMLVVFPAMAGNSQAVRGAILTYLFFYVLMVIGAFASVSAMEGDGRWNTDINRLSGLSKKRPILAAVFSVFLLSLLGIPPTAGFFAKYYLFLTAVKSGLIWLVVAAVLNSAISAYYYLRPIVVMYFYNNNEGEGLPTRGSPTQDALPLSPAIVAVLALTSLGVLYFGIFPADILSIISASV